MGGCQQCRSAQPPGLLSDTGGYEIGPAILLPDHRVFITGANGSTGNTAFYNPSNDTWSAGKPLPYGCTGSDTAAALLPNGDVLLDAWNATAGYVFEFNPTTNTYTDQTPMNFHPPVASHSYMLVLPTGQILYSNDGLSQLDVFTPNGSPNDSWRPVITDITQSGNNVVTLTGTQLNGISEGALWGDDNEAYTNYPLVLLHNIPLSGTVYRQTFNWSSTGVATGSTPESVQFNLGSGFDVLLSVAADGISSSLVLNVEMSSYDNNILLRRDRTNPALLDVLYNGSLFDQFSLSSLGRVIVTGAINTNNTLTVDYSSGGFFATPVTFDGGAGGSNSLTVNDTTDATAQSWTVAANSITTNVSGNPTVAYRGVQVVNLNSGNGGTINVTGTSASTNLVCNGSATVNVGNGIDGVRSILGTLNIENLRSTTVLNVGDDADTIARNTIVGTYTPAGDTPWGFISGLAPADIHYEYADTSSVTIRTGTASGNLIRVWEDGVPTNVISHATATVNIGDGLVGVRNILGLLTIENTTAYTTIWIDDTADPSARTTTLGTYTPGGDTPWGYISGLAPADIHYQYADTSSLTINGSRANGNLIRVWEDGVPTYLNGNATATVNVGDGYVGVQNIHGLLSIENPSSSTAIWIDDTADPAARTATLGTIPSPFEPGWGYISGLAPADIHYEYADTSSLTINGSRVSGNLTRVWEDGVPTYLNGNATATVNVGDGYVGVQSIQGTLSISNSLSQTVLNVDDSADQSSHPNVVLSSASLTGLAPAAINFGAGNVASLTVNGGQGGNIFDLSAGTSAALVRLQGGGGSNMLIGSSVGNSWEITGADTGVLSGAAYPTAVSFSQVGSLTAGSGGDYFLFDDGATLSGNLSGNLTGGGADTLDYTPYTSSVVVDLQTGIATGVGGSLSGIVNVLGGSGVPADSGVYNLLIGSGGNTLTGGTGRRNILVAGGSASTLNAGDGEDLLIGGSTNYDSDPALAAWLQIADYWAGTDDFFTRVANLTSGNGVPLLDASMVTGNNGGNTMNGNGALALIFSDGADNISGFDPNSPTVPITP